MSEYRQMEEAELDRYHALAPESWPAIYARYGGRNRLVDRWLAHGITQALQTIHRGRWNRRSPRAATALDNARAAAHELEQALWEETSRR